jgi:hypothetical protein
MFQFPTLTIYHSVSEPAGDGGASAGQGTLPPDVQPQGQGVGDGQSTADSLWGFFPDVPVEQRGALEPHLKNVQAHVTRMEQQYAPFKPFVNAGYTPDMVNGLVSFATQFDQNPLQAWIELGTALQQDDGSGQYVISPDVDFDILGALARGEDVPDDEEGMEAGLEGETRTPGDSDPSSLPPEALQLVQQLQGRIDELEGRYDQDQTRTRERAAQRVLTQQYQTIRQAPELKGYPKEVLTDELLRSVMITANGNTPSAIQLLKQNYDGVVKGFTQQQTQRRAQPLDTSKGIPQARPRPSNGDSWGQAREGARGFLKRRAQDAAQG